MDLEKIKKILYDENYEKVHWNGEKSGEYYHGERVSALALKLRTYILPNDDGKHDDIIKVAGWFHDITKGTNNHTKGADNHNFTAAERAKILLAEHCSEYEMQEIYNIICRHDERLADRDKFSVYAKIHQDADFLDHFGTYDILVRFFCASRDGMTIIEQIEDMKSQYENRYKDFEDLLNFDISLKIYKEKIEFYRQFTERFSVEGIGGIWGEEMLMN